VHEGHSATHESEDRLRFDATAPTTTQRPRRRRVHLATVIVFVGLSSLTLVGFFAVRHVLLDEEQHLLDGRADELHAQVDNGIASADLSLRILDGLAATNGSGAFKTAATALLTTSGIHEIAIARDENGRVEVVQSASNSATGAIVDEERSAVIRRALQTKGLAGGGLSANSILLARPSVSGGTTVVFAEAAVMPIPNGKGSGFERISAAIYNVGDRERAHPIASTSGGAPMHGNIVTRQVQVGGEQWVLEVTSRSGLLGGIVPWVAWILLATALGATVLAAAYVESIRRREDYANALVTASTGDLQDALSLLQAVFDSSPNTLYVVGADERFEKVSAAVESLLGYTPEEMVGRPALDLVNDADQEAVTQAGEPVRRGVVARARVPFTATHRDGRQLVIEADLATVGKPGPGMPHRTVVITRDITEERELANAQQRAVEAAEAANRAKSEWMSRVSHELRTPLNAILGFAQLMTLDDLSEPNREAVNYILESGVQLLAMVNEVLDISRADPAVLVESAPAGKRRILAPSDATSTRHTLLHIEDNVANARLVERFLAHRKDLELVTSLEGRGGLEWAREHRPSIVLLDRHLPDTDGDTLLLAIRADPDLASTPVIVLSADASPAEVDRILASGADSYIVKPLDLDRLLREVDRLLATTSDSSN
jgi:PAS domain S-box-containing protein